MVPGMRRCIECGSWFSVEEVYSHDCVNRVNNIVDKLNYIHCVFQELEGMRIGLPMGDYSLVYDILEDIRDDFEIRTIMNGEI